MTRASQSIVLAHMGPQAEWVDLSFLARVLHAYFGLEATVDIAPIVTTVVGRGEAVRLDHPRGGSMQFLAKPGAPDGGGPQVRNYN